MKSVLIAIGVSLSLSFASSVLAADHRVEVLEEHAPADLVGPEIAEDLSATGLRVIRGKSTKLCDIWLRKSWPVRANFTPSLSELYPFGIGELIGVVQYHRDGEDFRAQEIPEGIYTLRFALQPVDGNHVGTSQTRDFLLLLPAADDQQAAAMEESQLWELSATAVGTSHPAMLSLVLASDDTADQPSIAHNEDFDQWTIAFQNQAEADGDSRILPVSLVIVGHAAE